MGTFIWKRIILILNFYSLSIIIYKKTRKLVWIIRLNVKGISVLEIFREFIMITLAEHGGI